MTLKYAYVLFFCSNLFITTCRKKTTPIWKKNDTKTAPFFILKGCGRNILYCLHSNRLSLFLYQIFYLVIMTNCSAANFRFFKCYQLSPYVPAVMPYLLFIAIYWTTSRGFLLLDLEFVCLRNCDKMRDPSNSPGAHHGSEATESGGAGLQPRRLHQFLLLWPRASLSGHGTFHHKATVWRNNWDDSREAKTMWTTCHFNFDPVRPAQKSDQFSLSC